MSSPPPKKTTRKVGAPYGNHNALKHGFYSQHFRTGELTALKAVDAQGLQDEIAAMRIYIRRFIVSSGRSPIPAEGATDSDRAAAAPYHDMVFLDAIGLAATRLASLIKTQKLIDHQYPRSSDDLTQALAEVAKEMGITVDP